MEKTVIKIDGMMCGMCESHICQTIRQNFEVNKVTASRRKKEAVILSDQPIPEKDLQDVIEKTGYHPGPVHHEPYEKKNLFHFG